MKDTVEKVVKAEEWCHWEKQAHSTNEDVSLVSILYSSGSCILVILQTQQRVFHRWWAWQLYMSVSTALKGSDIFWNSMESEKGCQRPHLVATYWAGMPFTRAGCSEFHPASSHLSRVTSLQLKKQSLVSFDFPVVHLRWIPVSQKEAPACLVEAGTLTWRVGSGLSYSVSAMFQKRALTEHSACSAVLCWRNNALSCIGSTAECVIVI